MGVTVSYIETAGTGLITEVSSVHPLPVTATITGNVTASNPSVGLTAAAVPGSETYIGLNNGGNLVGALADSSGRQIVAGAGVAGTPAGGVLTIQGVTSGTPVIIPYSRDVEASISFQANGGVTHTYAIGEAFGGLFTIDLSATIGAVAREIYIKKATIINSTGNATISFATIAYFFPTAPVTTFTDASAVTWNTSDNALLSAGFALTFGAGSAPLTNTGANFFNGQSIPVKTGSDGKIRVAFVNNTASAAMTSPVNTTYTFDFAY